MKDNKMKKQENAVFQNRKTHLNNTLLINGLQN